MQTRRPKRFLNSKVYQSINQNIFHFRAERTKSLGFNSRQREPVSVLWPRDRLPGHRLLSCSSVASPPDQDCHVQTIQMVQGGQTLEPHPGTVWERAAWHWPQGWTSQISAQVQGWVWPSWSVYRVALDLEHCQLKKAGILIPLISYLHQVVSVFNPFYCTVYNISVVEWPFHHYLRREQGRTNLSNYPKSCYAVESFWSEKLYPVSHLRARG